MAQAQAELAQVGQHLACCKDWPERFPPQQWTVYRRVLDAVRDSGISFAIGGGLAARAYAGDWRNSKDIDLYIRPQDRERTIEILKGLGLRDYFEKREYDRRWIYRSYEAADGEDTIVDVIWAMANQRAEVTEEWLAGPEVEAGTERFRLLAPEYSLWSKLYVLQHDRSDWPDAMDLLYSVGPVLNWRRLLGLVGSDRRLLGALMGAFAWVAPERARALPEWVWGEVGMLRPDERCTIDESERRVRLLDSRPWFTGVERAAAEAKSGR